MRKLILLSIAAAGTLGAQAPSVRLISLPDAQTKPIFGVVPAVRQLPNGGLLVNDVLKRQLTMLDPALANPAIIADSSAGAANSYGLRGGGLIAYAADSTLFVDPSGLSMFVIDPAGKIARVASIPRSQDAGMIGSNVLSSPGLDSKGRLVYRGGLTLMRPPVQQGRGNGGPVFVPPEFPDSSAIVRVDITSRKLDTAAFYKIAKTKMVVQQTENGGMSMTNEQNPMPQLDEWAVLADGSIAIVRGQDYHVDFVDADGKITSAPKIPYDWQRLSDDDKVAVIDSAKKAFEAARAAAANAPPGSGPVLAGGGGAGPTMVISMTGRGGGDGGGGVGQRIMAGGGPGGATLPNITFIAPSELPDYRPVVTPGSAKGDFEGNLWVRTTASRAGAAGPIYDVINRKGELIDRIQIPAGRQIVGFGKGGVVYMVARDNTGSWIERTHR